MNLLLDSHALIWFLADDRRLSRRAYAQIRDEGNLVFVSAATAWEITIKSASGKLKTPGDLPDAMRANDLWELPITIEHGVAAANLPRHHGDPFDRMLVAQARAEGLTIVTRDERIAKYDVRVVFA